MPLSPEEEAYIAKKLAEAQAREAALNAGGQANSVMPEGIVPQAQAALREDPLLAPSLPGPIGAAVGSEIKRPGEGAALGALGNPGIDEMSYMEKLKNYLAGMGK